MRGITGHVRWLLILLSFSVISYTVPIGVFAAVPVNSWMAESIDGSMSPPPYGLRLDGFFDGVKGNGVTFSFDSVRFDEFADGGARLSGTVSVAEFKKLGGPGAFASTWDLDISLRQIDDAVAQVTIPSYTAGYQYFVIVPQDGIEMINRADSGDIANLWTYPDSTKPFQVGPGANEKNAEFGASAWVNYVHEKGGVVYGDSTVHIGKSDLLMNLVPIQASPLACPADTSVTVCAGSEVCISGFVCPTSNCTTSLGILTGDQVCFTADSSGVYEITLVSIDGQGTADSCVTRVTVDVIDAPVVPDESFFSEECNLRSDRLLTPSYGNQPGSPGFALLSGAGTIDAFTGAITYRPDTAGVFEFTVEVFNSCGADTATIRDSLILNQPPSVFGRDTTVTLCDVQEICLDVFSFDVEDDPVTIAQLEGLGTFTQLSDSSGQTCFIPADVDSAVYTFIYRATDSCVLVNDANPPGEVALCCLDTVTVTVLINQPPLLTCTGPQSFFACADDTICFDVSYTDDDSSSVSLNVLSGNATVSNGKVCLLPGLTGTFDVVIEARDSCRSDTCTVPITVRGNSPPMAHTAGDFSMSLCSPEVICFAATVDDPDFNLASTSTNFGSYDAGINRFCFVADSSGVYTLILSGADSCGAVDADTTVVTVNLDSSPLVSLGPDSNALCTVGEICIPATIEDNNVSLITSNVGVFDTASSTLCFTPDTAGTYSVILQVSDDCGNFVADTALITVSISNQPMISGFADTNVFLCAPEQICLPTVISDAGNDIQSITLSRGTFSNGNVCFVPFDSGMFEIVLTVVDSCGNSVTDTAVVNVSTDQGVQLSAPADTSVFLCSPDTICIPVTGVPVNSTVTVGGTGVWWDEAKQSVCFYSDCCLENTITVSATTPCATFSTQIRVSVTTNGSPLVILPPDSAVLACDLSPVCVPVGISDGEGNIDSITVQGGTYDAFQNTICFTPDTAGVYTLTAQAVDSCGEVDSDTMLVSVALNEPPVIVYTPTDTLFSQCAPEQICLPVDISDPEMMLDSVIVIGGSYNELDKTVCILPDGPGDFFASVVAIDGCGVRDSIEIAITVTGGDFVNVICPTTPLLASRCDSGQVCVPLEITGSNFTVDVSGGIWSNGQLCFNADSSGRYDFVVTAQTNCGLSVCSLSVDVRIDRAAAITCPVDQSVFLCSPDTLAFGLEVGGTVDSLTVSGSAFIVGDSVFVPVLSAGQAVVELGVFGPCADAACSFTVTAAFNSPPTIQGSDAEARLCSFSELCFPFTVTDADGNLDSISSSLGIISGPSGQQGGTKSRPPTLSRVRAESSSDVYQVCFTPDRFGPFEIVLTAFDSCGATGVDTIVINVVQGDTVGIAAEMPSSPFEFCTVADSVCWPVTVSGVPMQVTTSLGSLVNGQLCFLPDTAGVYTATIAGVAECGSDTLTLMFDIVLNEPISITCPAVDTTVSECSLPNTLVFPLAVSGTVDSLSFSLPGVVFDSIMGTMTIPIDSGGVYDIASYAHGPCGVDSCSFVLTVDGNVPPVVSLGPDTFITLCGPSEVCLPFAATDADLDSLDLVTSTGQVSGDSVCFMADSSGRYEIILTATDLCGTTDADTILVDIVLAEPVSIDLGPDSSRFLCGDSTACVTVATTGHVTVVTTNLGSYLPGSGRICFTADTAGLYTVIAEATDSCGSVAVDTVLLDVQINRSPLIFGFADTSLFICSPTPVCLPVTIDDPDGNIADIQVNRGQYADGQVCFVPYNMGLHEIVLTVADSCGLITVDTAVVDVQTDQAVSIDFPKDTSVFLCQPDTLCFPVGGVPSDATVRVGGTNVWWDAQKQSVCFFSDCCLENMITVTVTTNCGNQFKSLFTVNVRTNSSPLAILPPDTTISQCLFESVCFPVAISDADNNLTSVVVSGGTFDSFTNTVCFTPDTAGVYAISAVATDSCGAVDRDDLFVTIKHNQPPVISYTPIDTAIKQCMPEEICIPVNISDSDNNVVDVSVIGGRYDSLTSSICILPTGVGLFCADVTATDACGLVDSATICVDITGGGGTSIACPIGVVQADPICGLGTVCAPLQVLGSPDSVISTVGTWANDTLCFNADSSGVYTATVISYAQCNIDTCVVSVRATIEQPPGIICPADTSIAVCQPDTVCRPFTTSGKVDSVTVTPPAFINGNQVCVPVSQSGQQTITMLAFGPCGIDSCSFNVTTDANSPPAVDIISADFAIKQCQLAEICVPISIDDVDGNIADTLTSFGVIRNDSLCFTPSSFGTFALVLSAFDQCGAFSADTVNIQVIQGQAAAINCPSSPQTATVCQADTVCIPVTITGADSVSVFPTGWYDAAGGKICVPVDSAGLYSVTIRAVGFCGDDSCSFDLRIVRGIPPNVSCPVTVDTTLCLNQPDSVCFPVTITGSGLTVTVEPAGRFENGIVCVPVSSAGQSQVTVRASGECGVDSCIVTLNVTDNQAPLLTLPSGPLSIDFCPRDTIATCFDGIFANDADGSVTISKVCGGGVFEAIRPDSGKICFLPPAVGRYEFCFVASDGCRSDSGSLFVDVTERTDCDVCLSLAFRNDSCVNVGENTRMAITARSNDAVGGFELLFGFDASALAFSQATIEGTSIETWEYFTWNIGSAACGAVCPSGLVRVVGIADQNNGPAHPPDSAFHPNGDLVFVDFRVANDQNLSGQFVPINWSWYDCNDNSFSDPSGTILFVDNRIFGNEGDLIWDESDDVTFPESARPFGVGSPDDCFTGGGGVAPLRCLDFTQGGICIGTGTGVNNRGDINLNGLAYEVGDAVLFTNFFIRGLGVFTVDVPAQIAATDVNADGLTLTVADLVFLIRVITGDADPVPKAAPYEKSARISLKKQNDYLILSGETEGGIGGLFATIRLEPGMEVGEPILENGAAEMDYVYSFENAEFRLLVYSMETGQIMPGESDIVRIPIRGEGDVQLSDAQVADYFGRPYTTSTNSAVIPREYSLSQNYPNPFNPNTTISFSLASGGDWRLVIYNVAGGVVREFIGNSEAGVSEVVWDGRDARGLNVASGVYFYRLSSGSFSESKKMILLK